MVSKMAHWLRTWPSVKFWVTAACVGVGLNLIRRHVWNAEPFGNFGLFESLLCTAGLIWGFSHRPRPVDVRRGPWTGKQ